MYIIGCGIVTSVASKSSSYSLSSLSSARAGDKEGMDPPLPRPKEAAAGKKVGSAYIGATPITPPPQV